MKTSCTLFTILTIAAALATNERSEGATPILSGFDQQILDRNDDGSTGLVPIGFQIDFFGGTQTALYVNNNGNVTFDSPLAAYVPETLTGAGTGILAPFWADVDTRNLASGVVTYGNSTVNGHAAFGVDWVNVGYYSMHADLLLSCQLIIIDRSDLAPGDFDLEFNYGKVQWQWGDVSVGYPPYAGFSDSTTGYDLPGSGVDGAFMDTNTATGLIYNSLNSSVPGRYVFFFRDGEPVPEPAAIWLSGVGLTALIGALTTKRGFIHPTRM